MAGSPTPDSKPPESQAKKAQPRLTIAWQMPDPPVKPRNNHTFTPDTLDLSAPGEPAADSPSIAVPTEAYRLIYEAFRHKLGRFTAWQAPEPLAAHSAFQLAASLYKRGVSRTGHAPSQRSGQYDIELVPMASPLLKPGPDDLVVVDGSLCRHWDLPAFANAVVIDNVSEQIKQLSLVDRLIEAHSKAGKPRHWLIFGGGILCDTAAFAADLTGSSFTLVPTTLLAMADACVGGKTGVNFPPFGKNQLGRFAFPAKVVCCPEFLTSLPERELRCGIAECLKHGLLSGNEPLISRLTAMADKGDFSPLFGSSYTAAPSPAGATSDLLTVMAVKADVVAADPGEAGLRATLNFGHTLGHAIEALCHARQNTDIHHGEAVYFGMVFAAILSEQQTGLPAATKAMIIAACRACYPALSLKTLTAATGLEGDELFAALMAKMTTDKKNVRADQSAKPVTNWVLLQKLGQCYQSQAGGYTKELSYDAVRAAWPEYTAVLQAMP